MAQHKVPQDVEADDKFLGPLSFKQFIFGGLTVICAYLSFVLITRNLSFLSPIFILPMIVFGFLAYPWSKEQPTELWLAARIRFLIKPRKRIWDQSGMKQLVEITVPKKVLHNFTDGLSQREVRNRLSALATMVDSRGWAVKNYSGGVVEPSDRLVVGNVSEQSAVAITDSPEDVMDEQSGVIAKQFENKIQESEAKHKSEAKRLIEEARHEANAKTSEHESNTEKLMRQQHKGKENHKQEDFWFMHNTPHQPSDPSLATFSSSSVIHPGEDSSSITKTSSDTIEDSPLDEAAVLDKIHENKRRGELQTSHIRKVDPFAKKAEQSNSPQPSQNTQNQPMTTETKPDMLKYVYNND